MLIEEIYAAYVMIVIQSAQIVSSRSNGNSDAVDLNYEL